MYKGILWMLLFIVTELLFAQENTSISGIVLDELDNSLITGATVAIEGELLKTTTNQAGEFLLAHSLNGDYILNISYNDFTIKRIPINLQGKDLDLGHILLKRDIAVDKQVNLITLTESEILDDEASANALGLLQSTRDVFLNRAAFDFGQAFFRVRGYDSQNGEVLLNGMPMNKIYDGRPQWNNWGGLNDVIRNQQYSNGLEASDYTFGGILGNTNIDLRPSGLRPGLRISSSATNRTYTGRVMATYNSGLQDNKIAYIFSTSRRWAKEGYIDGTLYDAYSFYGSLEFKFNTTNTISLTAIMASNRRGRSSALTREVFDLVGNKYNPYWGIQNGKIRNSRERKIAEPIVLLNYFYEHGNVNVTAGIMYQTGNFSKSRLGYFNSPNPDPTYYRFLPSFYINSPIGANFESAEIARESFISNPQLDWNSIYRANTSISQNGKAAYVLCDDTTSDTQLTARLNGNLKLADNLKLGFGILGRNLVSKNYAEITDLLGANYHKDIDPFSLTRNNINGDIEKSTGDIFNYNYNFKANQVNANTQLSLDLPKWKAFLAGNIELMSYQRKGNFQNERFLDNSLGESEKISFSNYGLKAGLTKSITGRHWVSVHGALIKKAPLLQNSFINPRESNALVPNLESEKISTADINYYIRMPKLIGRVTGYYTRFQNTTDINFFFVDAGVGSDFVQEVLTGLDKLHLGTELGLEYQLSSSVKLSTVASIGKYLYASDPMVTINFDTAAAEDELIDVSGSKDLGIATIKGYKLAQGPQKAMAFGIEYRDPKYWWVGVTANYLANNYANISTITRTNSFMVDPETGTLFPDASIENLNKLLRQKPLDNFYLLNMVGGKSWLTNGKYIGVFASINNVFDTKFRTGGYEQSRNGNYGQLKQDNLSGSPSFAPKYWYGYGRTYFLNLSISF
ncbi:carboxypeptidase-like regulatory domain-containing protein [Maribacter sp. CXY002]|uniref:carboxypeptidase-like regulatory domain-containing protein n=1 Tax=Maribacter luteocoastalis TaxID=3407671 RepID=UPI003B66F806